ncbi:MAG: MFS transporter [Oscillospiraceae bacterium]|nr:MFS transporter [Oscillospiraceae bacterium]
MNPKRVKLACYITNMSMSVVCCLSALLFTTFHRLYNISFASLGLLVFVNYITQLAVDLICTFCSKHFNIEKTVKTIPFITVIGFLIYGLSPFFLPQNPYIGFMIGTIIFSSSAGLNEVLVSPVIAALPSDTKEKDMSFLHATYGLGVIGFVLIGTLFLYVFKQENWMYLPLICSVVPLVALILFSGTHLPPMNNTEEDTKEHKNGFSKGILLCALTLFFCGAAECTMTQWSSSFVEIGLGVSKITGDLLGMFLFAVMLTFGRMLYSKIGGNIFNVMTIGLIGAVACYLMATLTNNSIIAVIASVFTGLSVSMLWPGTLIIIGENYPKATVSVYALMAVAGDMGGAIIPYAVGILIHQLQVTNNNLFFTGSIEQNSMRGGLLFATIFPLLGLITILVLRKHLKIANHEKNA